MDNGSSLEQAKLQLSSIYALVDALSVDYDRLAKLRLLRLDSPFPSRTLTVNPDHTTCWWEDVYPLSAEELAELEGAAGDCNTREDAETRLLEDPLSIEFRSGWSTSPRGFEPEEFRIVLCTGGPHVEIQGDFDENGDPDVQRLAHKDWGTSGFLYDFDWAKVQTYVNTLVPNLGDL